MFPITTVALIFALALLCLYTLHKVRLIHLLAHELKDQAQQSPANLFRQLEALQGLYVDLRLERSLPGTRGWAASPDFLEELVRHAFAARPRVVVECSSGTSTLVLARCMQLNGRGKVYSLEHDAQYAEQTRQQLQLHGLAEWAVVLEAPLREHALGNDNWPWYVADFLPEEAAIDMLVIDGPPLATRVLARYPAGPLLFRRMAADGTVFLDDAGRPDEQAILRRWKSEFPMFEQTSRPCEKGCAVLTRRADSSGAR
ncbi:class I SAM-dependent methyltransferase [Janthinobacterium fluminis]|uniref:Class I SAM-dependent methyltransferase n=1 Tax=Janthinobacterium fluminis TaxID=2987524 RepID=A0ABT5JVW1_9BURK|nr:class I SAM-dependent methyltransferase [Janthinobacterium fluminis]MDC8756858.1 class I SAM-dependent methyltransferase [Janthinobacterium fluminis]